MLERGSIVINGYSFQNVILLLLFFLLVWIDGRVVDKGGWLFYVNKIMALFAILGSFLLVDFILYSWFYWLLYLSILLPHALCSKNINKCF